MKVKIINRKYILAGKLFRFKKMRGVSSVSINIIGYKICIGRYELRLYL